MDVSEIIDSGNRERMRRAFNDALNSTGNPLNLSLVSANTINVVFPGIADMEAMQALDQSVANCVDQFTRMVAEQGDQLHCIMQLICTFRVDVIFAIHSVRSLLWDAHVAWSGLSLRQQGTETAIQQLTGQVAHIQGSYPPPASLAQVSEIHRLDGLVQSLQRDLATVNHKCDVWAGSLNEHTQDESHPGL